MKGEMKHSVMYRTMERRVKQDARLACAARGHQIARFQRHHFWKHTHVAYCQLCDAQVVVNLRPAPNEILIGGQAVAITCKDNREYCAHKIKATGRYRPRGGK